MFSEFHDLPVHALAVHGAVVLVPLSALFAVLFAIPRTRKWANGRSRCSRSARWSPCSSPSRAGRSSSSTSAWPRARCTTRSRTTSQPPTALYYLMLAFTVLAIVAFALSRAGKLDGGALSIVVSVVLVVAAAARGLPDLPGRRARREGGLEPGPADVDYSSIG